MSSPSRSDPFVGSRTLDGVSRVFKSRSGELTDWSSNGHLHGHLRSWGDSVVGVRHEAGILTSGKLFAWSGEGRLCDSVIL